MVNGVIVIGVASCGGEESRPGEAEGRSRFCELGDALVGPWVEETGGG